MLSFVRAATEGRSYGVTAGRRHGVIAVRALWGVLMQTINT
jgi:hypothetical protein